MKKFLIVFLLILTSQLYAQDWEKVNDYMGLDSYSSYYPLIGTNDGLVERVSQGYNNWRHLGLKGKKVCAIMPISNGVADTIIVGTDEGIYYTPDYGINWHKTNAPEIMCHKIEMVQSYKTRFLALTSNGVYHSSTGVNWSLYALEGKDVRSYESGGHINSIFGFVCADDYYYSEDYGETYKAAGINLTDEPLLDLHIYATITGGYKYWISLVSENGIYHIRMDSLYFGSNPQWEKRYNTEEGVDIKWFKMSGDNYTLVTNKGIYFSQDSARTFTNENHLKGALTNGEFRKQTFNSPSVSIYTSEGDGLFYNNDPIGLAVIKTLQLAPDGSMFIGTNGFGVFQSKDNGSTWVDRNKGLSNFEINDLEFISDGRLYAATSAGAYVSSDNGANWSSVTPTTPRLFSLMEVHPKEWNEIFASGKNSFYKLATSFNWNGGIDNLNGDIYTIKYNPKTSMYLAGGKYGLWKSETAYVSWKKMSFASYSIYDIEIDSKGRILALTSTDIYYSDDDGESWETLSFIPKNYKKDLLLDKADNYYVATDGGVYYSTDRGVNWFEMNEGLKNLPYKAKVTCLEIDNSGHLWASTITTGLYRSKASIAASSGTKNLQSQQKGIKRLYYNNASESLFVELANSLGSSCQIAVFSLDGRLVRLQYDQQISKQQIEVSLNHVSSGIYILKLIGEKTTYTDSFVVR